MTEASVDLERLLKLRLVVARFGEMDAAQWWNTKGQLGPLGRAALRRGFPRTHNFAQARSVFAVAAHRCDEVFSVPGSVTLWRLPAQIEAQFDARWEDWLDDAGSWEPFFDELLPPPTGDLAVLLRSLGAVEDRDVELADQLKPDGPRPAVEVTRAFAGSDTDVALLALGFGTGTQRSLVVPYALEGSQ